MKGSRAILMIAMSCIAAVIAVVLASRWMNEQASLRTRKIAVVAADINLGIRLTPDMIRMAEWPADSIPAGSFTDVKQLDGRVTRLAIQRGEPLLATKLAAPGAAGGLSA